MASTKNKKSIKPRTSKPKPVKEEKPDVSQEVIEITKEMQKYVTDESFTINTAGKSIYECCGVDEEEMACFITHIRSILRKAEKNSIKVQEVYNLLVSDKRYLASFIWLTHKTI